VIDGICPTHVIKLAHVIELSEKKRVQVRFLLGPAGTGKTFRCLEEIRAELKHAPGGPPLLFLAPKQATFQIERQLLSDPELPGYTRLQILPFDRLAQFVMETLGAPALEILSEEGRVMVLRALLAEKHDTLKLFRSTARLPGFAQQLSGLLRELQQQRLSAEALLHLTDYPGASAPLRDKLHDVALLLRFYREWLHTNGLHDSEELLDAAAQTLRDGPKARDGIGGGIQLWLDGFAEMTPQELNLLAAFVPLCGRATLAFCLESAPTEANGSWLSLWSVVAQTFRRCRAALSVVPGIEIATEVFDRTVARGRFVGNPTLAHLEACWSNVCAFDGDAQGLSIVKCANPEAEAVFAAREILRLVRDGGARFRDCAVLLRSLDGYHDTLRRVFTRYGIPFFLDRRESVAHHPLAELTRFALRTAAFGWRRDDWFGALKTGLVHRDEESVDALENEALARGWDGAQWVQALPGCDGMPNRFEPLRQKLTPAFEKLAHAVAGKITGEQIAAALRTLWSDLRVEKTLERWTEETKELAPQSLIVHDTVWTQMSGWLENLARAFRTQPLSVSDWLPVLEAGLSGLTVGAIPPALDQVLIGTIDRSRNPELRLALVLGLNETIFPAPPPRAPILTESERAALMELLVSGGQSLGLGARQRMAHERFFGYIACTRASERLVLTHAAADAHGTPLHPSPFLAQVAKLFPGIAETSEVFFTPDWRAAEHACEIAAPLIDGAHPQLAPLGDLPALAGLIPRAEQLNASLHAQPLAREIAERLYRVPLATSVSALEDFAACPFKFFVKHGLRVQERQEFEVDHRQKGSFQHEVLSEFHLRATRDGKRWRDWSPENAVALLRQIGVEKLKSFEGGLFDADQARRFTAEMLLQNLERLVATLVAWMEHYRFEPQRVELAFGLTGAELPGWEIDLDGGRKLLLRGKVDRIDLLPLPDSNSALAVVIDYKSSARKVDAVKLHNGLELQLLSYVGWLRQAPAEKFGVRELIPAGVFYVGLRGGVKGAGSRDETFDEPEAARRKAFQHSGRFNENFYGHLDATDSGEQFATHYMSRNKTKAEEFTQLVADVERHVKQFGNRILDGVIEIVPYRKAQETACSRCEFQGVCRFDSWVEPFRPLQPLPRKAATKGRKA
jgi:ATP-dependent helicase/nuclease subunit B